MNPSTLKSLRWPTSVVAVALLVAACDGSSSSAPAPAPAKPLPPVVAKTYPLTASVAGLYNGQTVVLSDLGGIEPNLSVSQNGAATFATLLAASTKYTVIVRTQPIGETCTVAAGEGKIAATGNAPVAVTCTPNPSPAPTSFSVGGTVSGLQANQSVVLQNNGADSITVTNNGNFVFPTQLALNDSYYATVLSNTLGVSCTVVGFSGDGYVLAAVTSIVVDCAPTGTWTWQGGSQATFVQGTYGTQGVPSGANVPGSLAYSTYASDAAGNLWVFGGQGTDMAGNFGDLGDLWEYRPASNTWTWVSGTGLIDAVPSYGQQGVADAGNTPGARNGQAMWIDSSGNLWVFGGSATIGFTQGTLSDLWEYSPSTGMWTWQSGPNTLNTNAVYGTQGTAAGGNLPGPRILAATWRDAAGNFWLFGGNGADAAGNYGTLNDMWEFSPSTGMWTWQSGSSLDTDNAGTGASGVYGVKGTQSAGNVPGARSQAAAWVDANGAFWMYGGNGVDSTGNSGNLGDMWQFDPTRGIWTWQSGSALAGTQEVTGIQGVASASNTPGGCFGSAVSTDAAGNLWLFSCTSDGALFRYTPATNGWIMVGGSRSAIYGNQGVPDAANSPGALPGAMAGFDASGNLWVFGGNQAGSYVNSLWQFTPTP